MGGAAPPNLWLYDPEAKFVPLSGSAGAPSSEWMEVRIESHDGKLSGSIGAWDFMMAKPPLHPEPAGAKSKPVRSGFAFYLRGKDAELQIKDVKLEVAPK
jgi:hypothetical protein